MTKAPPASCPTLLRAADGTAAVEFALVALPFVVIVLAALQVLVLMLTQQMLETAAEAVGRQILTGTVQQNKLTRAQFASLACSLLPTTMDCARLIVDVQVASSFSTAVTAKPDLSSLGSLTGTTVLTFNPGSAGQIVVLRLLYALPVIGIPGLDLRAHGLFFGTNFPIATSVFKNESVS